MFFRATSNKRRKTKKKKEHPLSFLNLPIISLTIISIFFISSFIYEMKYNDRNNMQNINLQELLDKQSNSYEKKTGHKITLEVLNGCGQGKIAAMYQTFLRDEGFDVMDARNAPTYNHPYSKIEIHRGNIEMAHYLSNLMGIHDSLVIRNDDETLMIDISLLVGKDFPNLHSYDEVVRHYSRY